ncbi:MAG: anthranilate synthase component I family protein [Angustibacter sp.]
MSDGTASPEGEGGNIVSAEQSWAAEVAELPCTNTLEEVFDALYAGLPQAFWLDSSRQAYGMGQWSYLGAPAADACVIEQRGQSLLVRDFGREHRSSGSALDELSRRLGERTLAEGRIPFLGGFIGYFGYGSAGLEVRPRSDPDGADASWWEVQDYLAFDHEDRRLYAVTCGPPGAELATRAQRRAQVISRSLLDYPGLPPLPPNPDPVTATASVTHRQYLHDLAVVRSWLEAGDSYEACYTYQLSVPHRESPWVSYRRLRALNPAPYSAFLAMGERHIMSSSPERFLRVAVSGWAETKPIKGTISRLENRQEDEQQAKVLAHDPKSLSENLMIVDLLRNDLFRICHPRTVTVPKLMEIESYQTVHQLVTTVQGRISQVRPDFYLPSPFPGGSMTGAPKKRTVELLEELEAVPRGVYSGVLGFFSYTGAADLSIVIRTAVSDRGTVRVGTGGAITIKSDPHAEYAETRDKSAPLLAAFQAVRSDEG